MHLATLAQPMADPRVGVVTCLYRSIAIGVAGALDALGLSTDFQPSVLVARKIEGITFGLGSGTLVRRLALEAAGGSRPSPIRSPTTTCWGTSRCARDTAPFSRPTSSIMSCPRRAFAEWPNTSCAGTAASLVRPAGYLGLAFTQGVPASLLLLLLTAGSPASWAAFGLTLGARLAMAWFVAVRCLHDRAAARSLWLLPLRDL